MDFKQYIVERKIFADAVMYANTIAETIINKFLNNELSFLPRRSKTTIKLSSMDYDVVVLPFNVRNTKQQAIYTPAKNFTNPTITLYIFNILNDIPGLNAADLTEVFKNHIKVKRNRDKVSSILAHEIYHLFQDYHGHYSRSLPSNKPQIKNPELKYRRYINSRHEMHAHIVEYITELNNRWKEDYDKGIWWLKYRDPRIINQSVDHILDQNKIMMTYLTPNNTKKFKKSIYTTVKFLWDTYHNWSETRVKNQIFTQKELKAFINKNV